ncbi:Zeta Carotene Desaturase and Related Oxidoreductase [Abortiporus biennis]
MRVAVVGSGVSGLAATWLLNEHSDHEVHLFEADTRPGGHANTVTFTPPEGSTESNAKPSVDVDTGFIVFNPSTYPNFISFLSLYPDLKSRILPTEMTFSVSRDRGLFEWAGNNLRSVFCQPARLLDFRMWRLLYDVLRFNACARRFVVEHQAEVSIGEYLKIEGYSDAFRDDYLVPMTAAIWSTPPDKCSLDFPAKTLIQFMNNHHLLQITGKPSWLTLREGSRTYVKQIISSLPPSQLHLNTPIHSVTSTSSYSTTGIQIQTDKGIEIFDHVIMACHSDTTVQILKRGGGEGGITKDEERILGAFQWNRNEVVLHMDKQLMPKSRLAWSCWNYLTSSEVDPKGKKKANVNQVALTYWMNELQHISEKEHGPIFVTLNPPFQPDPEKTFGKYQYDHPIIDSKAIKAQREIQTIQNKRGISYAGAWLCYGFHEDGFTSGLRAAMNLLDVPGQEESIHPPFKIQTSDRIPQISILTIQIFHFLEWSGVGFVFGFILFRVLGLLRVVLGVDLSNNDPSVDKVEVVTGKSSNPRMATRADTNGETCSTVGEGMQKMSSTSAYPEKEKILRVRGGGRHTGNNPLL